MLPLQVINFRLNRLQLLLTVQCMLAGEVEEELDREREEDDCSPQAVTWEGGSDEHESVKEGFRDEGAEGGDEQVRLLDDDVHRSFSIREGDSILSHLVKSGVLPRAQVHLRRRIRKEWRRGNAGQHRNSGIHREELAPDILLNEERRIGAAVLKGDFLLCRIPKKHHDIPPQRSGGSLSFENEWRFLRGFLSLEAFGEKDP